MYCLWLLICAEREDRMLRGRGANNIWSMFGRRGRRGVTSRAGIGERGLHIYSLSTTLAVHPMGDPWMPYSTPLKPEVGVDKFQVY